VKYNWNWGIFWQLSPDGHGTYLDTLVAGLGWTLATALAAWVIALALGMIVGVVRTTPVFAFVAVIVTPGRTASP
jgi:glutamate/aspartate transport system permease protein